MGSILNFVYGNNEINGNHFFHQSGLYNYVNNNSNFSKTTHYHLSNSNKNIFLLECKESLRDFFKKDENGKTILDSLPLDFINSIKNGKTKILLGSVAEATEITNNFFDNLKFELNRFGLDERHLILLDSNQNFLDVNTNFKVFTTLHFIVICNYNPNEINDLNYVSELPTETEVLQITKRKKHFICLNRNSQRAHRYYLSLFFEKHKLYEKSLFSLLLPLHLNNFKKLNYLEQYKNNVVEKIPLELDTQNRIESLQGFHTGNTFFKEHYLDSYFNIVTETCFSEGQIFFTEKILKPIMCLQPFIVLSSPNYLKKLKELGFKTFDCIWDESYDSIMDNEDRLIKIFDLILKISNWSLEECEKNYKSVLDICIYNRNHLSTFWKIDEFSNILNSIKNEW
jgi:hypothetical protein